MEPGSRFWDVPGEAIGLPDCERATVVVPRGADPREVLRSDPVPIGLEVRLVQLPGLIAREGASDIAPGMLVIRESRSDRVRIALPELRELRARVALAPEAAGELAAIALAGVMVELRDLWAWTMESPEALASALELYLTHPELEAPIEPFHSLARGMGRREGRGLRAIAREVIRRDWRLSADGRVTLSERHEREGAFFGHLDDGEAGWRASELWRLAEARERTHFLERSRCSFCEHGLACGGYGAREGIEADPAWCETWLPLFARLRSAFALAVQEARDEALVDYPG